MQAKKNRHIKFKINLKKKIVFYLLLRFGGLATDSLPFHLSQHSLGSFLFLFFLTKDSCFETGSPCVIQAGLVLHLQHPPPQWLGSQLHPARSAFFLKDSIVERFRT